MGSLPVREVDQSRKVACRLVRQSWEVLSSSLGLEVLRGVVQMREVLLDLLGVVSGLQGASVRV